MKAPDADVALKILDAMARAGRRRAARLGLVLEWDQVCSVGVSEERARCEVRLAFGLANTPEGTDGA